MFEMSLCFFLRMSSEFQPIHANPFSGAMNPSKGLSISRRFTKEGQDPFWSTTYEVRDGVEVPRHWSMAATEIVAEKYLKKSGVPQKNADGTPQIHPDSLPVLGAETSVKQIIHRIVGSWRALGEQNKYFASARDAMSFYDEVVFMVLHQMVSPNADLWVRGGTQWAYGFESALQKAQTQKISTTIDDPEIESFLSTQKTMCEIRISNAFMDAVLDDREWHLRTHTDGSVVKTIQARQLWESISESIANGAAIGLSFETTQNEWNTCAKSGKLGDLAACNTATLNLGQFFDPKTMVFDVDSFKHASRLLTLALEISFTAESNQDFRAIGLGVTNLGTGVLVAAGIPYDSKEGRAISAAITSILTGESYATSAEIAKYGGAFSKFDLNRSDMLRVVRNHRRVAYNAPADEYEKISARPRGLDPLACPVYLLRAARASWDRALELGEIYGYRNAQTTAITINPEVELLLDASSSGIDPDSALVKVKKSVAGQYAKTVSDGISATLKSLSYSAEKIEDILRYVLGSGTLMGAPHINHEVLAHHGFSKEELIEIENKLPQVWSITEVMNPRAFGFSDEQVREVDDFVCGTGTIEGAPHMKKEHVAIFDCTAICGKHGERFVSLAGHIRMMAAIQPFLSGSISKIISMSNDVNKEGVGEAFGESWKMGLKSVAMRVQKETVIHSMPELEKKPVPQQSVPKIVPVAPAPVFEVPTPARAPAPVPEFPPVPLFNPEPEPEVVAPVVNTAAPTMAEKIAATSMDTDPHAKLYSAPVTLATGLQFGKKRALPAKRSGITVEAMVGNQQVYLRTGEYPNGDLGEIFIDMYREGAAFRSVLNCFAISISMGLQHGVPLEKFVEKFTFTRFEPSGFTSHPNVKMCTSIVDYIFRVLAVEYLGRMDLAQVPPEGIEKNRADKLQEIAQAALQVGEQTALLSGAAAQADAGAPPCDTCGHATIQNGDCFRCMNCGSSMGC